MTVVQKRIIAACGVTVGFWLGCYILGWMSVRTNTSDSVKRVWQASGIIEERIKRGDYDHVREQSLRAQRIHDDLMFELMRIEEEAREENTA